MLPGPTQNNWVDIPNLVGGWNLLEESSNIENNQSPSLSNVVFDGGVLSPRGGSILMYSKPASETGDPLQLITAKTSDGVEFLIAIYANHFYLWHDTNEEWIRINQSYVPTEIDLYYGYVNWNNGRGDDRLYVCNGVDSFIRWNMAADQANGAQSSGASTLVVDDATRFPATGTLVIVGASSVFTEAYTSHSATTFTLTNTLNQNVSDNASVTLDMIEKSSMAKGKVLTKHQLRLFVANYYGGETAIRYSIKNDPEDFTSGTGISQGSSLVIADGNGEIMGLNDFGEFMIIEKEDSLHSLKIEISSDLSAKLDVIVPIVSGQSVGPINQKSTVKALNSLMYLTRTEGFISVYPKSTGEVQIKTISDKIQPFVTLGADFDNSKAVVFDQKVLWAGALFGGSQNTQALMYDLIRDSWSLIKGWSVQDFAVKNAQLLFMDTGTGNIYRGFTSEYHDNNNPYFAEFFTKSFDFGALSRVKTGNAIYVQGYMVPATDLFIDVLYNELGVLKKQTFNINKDTENASGQNIFNLTPLTSSLGLPTMGLPMLGSVLLQELGDLSFFRCYLGISNRHGYYNIMLRIYSNKQAFWGITGLGFNTVLEEAIPSELFINPTVTS